MRLGGDQGVPRTVPPRAPRPAGKAAGAIVWNGVRNGRQVTVDEPGPRRGVIRPAPSPGSLECTWARSTQRSWPGCGVWARIVFPEAANPQGAWRDRPQAFTLPRGLGPQAIDFHVTQGASDLMGRRPGRRGRRPLRAAPNPRMRRWEYGKDVEYPGRKAEGQRSACLGGQERGACGRCPLCGRREIVEAVDMHPRAWAVRWRSRTASRNYDSVRRPSGVRGLVVVWKRAGRVRPGQVRNRSGGWRSSRPDKTTNPPGDRVGRTRKGVEPRLRPGMLWGRREDPLSPGALERLWSSCPELPGSCRGEVAAKGRVRDALSQPLRR